MLIEFIIKIEAKIKLCAYMTFANEYSLKKYFIVWYVITAMLH